jgi:hypothetical protein
VSGVVPVTVSSLVTEEKTAKLFVDADDASAQKYRVVDHPGHHRLSRAPFRALASFIPALKCLVIVVDATDSRGAYLRDVAEYVFLDKVDAMGVLASNSAVFVSGCCTTC